MSSALTIYKARVKNYSGCVGVVQNCWLVLKRSKEDALIVIVSLHWGAVLPSRGATSALLSTTTTPPPSSQTWANGGTRRQSATKCDRPLLSERGISWQSCKEISSIYFIFNGYIFHDNMAAIHGHFDIMISPDWHRHLKAWKAL